jgi:hypothetical protein
LIVASRDEVVLQLYRETAAKLQVEHQLVTIPEAPHLLEEPGKLEMVLAWRARTRLDLSASAKTLIEAIPQEL